MSTLTRAWFKVIAGILVGLAVLALVALAGWWLIGWAIGVLGSLDLAVRAALLTILVSAGMLAFAVRRRASNRPIILQRQADAYEAVLVSFFRPGGSTGNDWQLARARLWLWGSPPVIKLTNALERQGLPLALSDPDTLANLSGLIRAMRHDLRRGGVMSELQRPMTSSPQVPE